MRTRFAPSPTGDLHLGGAWTALASWVLAKSRGGRCLLRIEDLDTPRVVAGSQARIEEDLAWLGFTWDAGPVLQSQRTDAYEEAVAALARAGRVYPCDCSRADIARAASAPHAGEELIYPGTCRSLPRGRVMKRPAALRFEVRAERVAYQDGSVGPVSQDLSREVGDFVLRRGDGLFAYQLAVVVDDGAMGITDVVRGADLIASTPRQIALAEALGARPPRYTHVPLVVASDGARLEKRTRGAAIRELRDMGVSPRQIVGTLAYELGLAARLEETTPAALARALGDTRVKWRRDPWRVPHDWERA